MAKFCVKCGAPMEDGDRVCGQCGTPVVGSAPVPNAAPVNTAAPAKKSGDNSVTKYIPIIVGVIVAIVAVAVGLKVAVGFMGYKGTIQKMTKAIQKDDIDTLEELSSSIAEEMYGDNFYDYIDSSVSRVLDDFEDSVGNIKKIQFEVTDEKEMSDRRVRNLKEKLEDSYDMDTDSIKKVVEVEVKLTVKGSKKSTTRTVKNLFLIKEEGGWKLFYGNLL